MATLVRPNDLHKTARENTDVFDADAAKRIAAQSGLSSTVALTVRGTPWRGGIAPKAPMHNLQGSCIPIDRGARPDVKSNFPTCMAD